jgi:hypothetical protein
MKIFLDVMYDDTKNARKIKSCDYNHEGKYPIIDQSSKNVIGYTDEIDGLYNDVPVIIFGDHTRRFKLVEEPFFIGADGTKVLKLRSSVYDYKFIYYYLLHKKIPDTGYNRHFKWVKELEFPEIPRSIQSDIVKKLEVLNDLISSKNKLLESFDILIKSRFVELFGDVVLNTLNWPLVKLSDIAEYRIGLTYKPDAISSSGTAVLRSGNIQNSQLCYEDIIYVNSKVEPKLLLKNHDILMCARNGSQSLVGKVALIENDISNTTYGAFMIAISSKYYVYLFEYFRSQAFRRLISVGSTTTINQVTTRMLNSIVIPLPDLETINRFALYHSQINKLKSDVQKSIEETQLLMDSLMQEYFG